MATLTTEQRKKISKKLYALPREKSKDNPAGHGGYPIPDEDHARNALARVSQNGTPEEKAKVRAAVKKKYPDIEQAADK